MTRTDVLRKAIKTHGDENQLHKAVEELSELIRAISRYHACDTKLTRENLLEEIADVRIMLEQVIMIFEARSGAAIHGDTPSETISIIEGEKLARLSASLQEYPSEYIRSQYAK